MAIDLWVDPTRPDDSGNGQTPATAKKTITAGLTELNNGSRSPAPAKGDRLNLINSGTHTWPQTATPVDITRTEFQGTSETDPGCVIRGSTSTGAPALVTIASSGGTGARSVVRFRSPIKYAIVENVIGDATAHVSDTAAYAIVEWMDGGQGPIIVRYSAMLGAPSGQLSAGIRALATLDSTPSTTDQGVLKYCYFQNVGKVGIASALAGKKIRCEHVVYINDSGSGRPATDSIYAFPFGSLAVSDPARVTQLINCTVYEKAGSAQIEATMRFNPSTGVNAGTVDSYNNLLWLETTGTIEPFMRGGSLSNQTHVGTIGPNIFILKSGTLTSRGLYETTWDANDNDATPPDEWPLDIISLGEADTSVFNNPNSTFGWTLPNGLVMPILKDLRPKKYTSNGLFGTTPGALPAVSSSSTDSGGGDPDDPATIPFLDVIPFYTNVLTYSLNSRLSTKENRVVKHYLRKDREEKGFREWASRRLQIDTSSTDTIITGLEAAELVFFESDNAVRLNAGPESEVFLPAAKVVLAIGGSYNFVKLKNESATNAALALISVVD